VGIRGGHPAHRNQEQINQHFPNVKLLDLFGQTEMSRLLAAPPCEAGARGISSKPAPFVEVRIVDENDNEVPAGGRRGRLPRPTVMQEYYKDPSHRNAMRHGWSTPPTCSGLTRMDLYVVDRKKDMIISGGEIIYPLRWRRSSQASKIVECAVIGVHDDQWASRSRLSWSARR